MSDYDGMDRMAGEGLTRPTAANSVPGSGGTTLGSHAYVAQSPPLRVLARMPDMGPETTAIASEEPVPAPHEGRLVGARLSVNVLVGGVLVLMLLALIPFFFMKGAGAGRSESPAPNAPEAVRWNGTNSQVSNLPVPLSSDTARANDNSPTGNRSSSPNNGVPSGVGSSQDAALWSPPMAQPTPPASLPAADGGSPWNGQAPGTSAADAAGPWGSGNRSGPWPNPSAAADTAANRATTAWGDPSQSVAAAPATDPNRPVGPMMPTAPPVHNGIYEAARPAPAYQNNYPADPNGYRSDVGVGHPSTQQPYNYFPNARAVDPSPLSRPTSSEPSAYMADTRGGAAPAPWNANAWTGPPGYPTSTNPSSNYPSGVNPPNTYPSNGYPSNANPSNANPSNANPPNGYPSNANPTSGYPSSSYPINANPSGGYPSGVNPPNNNPPNNNPPNNNPPNGNPSTGYPSTGYPSSGYPSSNYPSSNANSPYPGASGPAVNPMNYGAAGYNGGTADPARAQFDGGIERPTIPGGYDNARSSLH